MRTPEEFAQGHLPGFRSAPGGQLVQETDHQAPVRGARIVLTDTDGVRANMSASWLAQMGWEVHVIDAVPAQALTETGSAPTAVPPPEQPIPLISVATLQGWLAEDASTVVIDFTTSANYVKRHIPGAWWALRSQLAEGLAQIRHQAPGVQRLVLTCGTSALAAYAVAETARLSPGLSVSLLDGGTQAWIDAGGPLESGETRLAAPRIDRYRRPYEGTDAPREAMQGYLDWEFGLVEQLGRDGTHGFRVI